MACLDDELTASYEALQAACSEKARDLLMRHNIDDARLLAATEITACLTAGDLPGAVAWNNVWHIVDATEKAAALRGRVLH